MLRLHYSSLTTPHSVYDQLMMTTVNAAAAPPPRVLKKVHPVLGGFDAADYATERLWAAAPDGVRVPVSVAYRKGLAKLDGSDPMFLNGCVWA